MNDLIRWLLESDPWTEYRTRHDLLGQSEEDKEVRHAKRSMLEHPQIMLLLSELRTWPGATVNNHKKAGLLMHKLSFIAEIGLTVSDAGIEGIINAVTRHVSDEGVPQVMLNIPKAFGGTGEDMWAWSLCDASLMLFALIKMGMRGHDTVKTGTEYLARTVRENGWPCVASPKLGRFRGPGRAADPCPYATMLMTKALAEAGGAYQREVRIGAECLLDLWAKSREKHPYLFRMGTDFRKLKAPFIWYDILHVADVLSQYDWLKEDARMNEIVDVISAKADADGQYTPESVWMAYKGFDFAQKKTPSSWLAFLALRIQKRFGRI